MIKEAKQKGFQGMVFGIVDGLICLIGTTFAISAISQNPKMVLATGIAVSLSNGLANATGFFLSEHVESEQKISNHTTREIWQSSFFCFSGAIMATILPLLPYLFLKIFLARIFSFLIAGLILFFLGFYHARISQEDKIKEGLKFLVISAFTAIICYGLGIIIRPLLS